MLKTKNELKKIDNNVKSRSLVTPVIKASTLQFLKTTNDEKKYRDVISRVFALNKYIKGQIADAGEELKEILIDLYQAAILFSSDIHLSLEKSIVLLSIFNSVLRECITAEFYIQEEIYEKYKKLLLSHSVERPPFSSGIFNITEVKQIDDFFMNTIFRNVKSLMNSFTKRPIISFSTKSPGCANPFSVPPLASMSQLIDGEYVPVQPVEDPKKGKKTGRTAQKERAVNEKSNKEDEKKKHEEKLEQEKLEQEKLLQEQQMQNQDQEEEQKEAEYSASEQEDRGPDVPLDVIKSNLDSMHDVFVTNFEETEHKLISKIKELEIKMNERSILVTQKKPGKK